MLYFQQLLHADVTSSKCRPQRNGMSTCKRRQVACCTSTTSACRCDLIKIAARDSGSSTATHCLWTKPGCACQKPTVIKAAAGQHWFPCEFPCNARATHVQHTCNTTCNTSTFTVNLQVRLPFLVRLLQSFFVSIWKRRSACNGKKNKNTCKFTVKVLVLHVVLHVCCTCVARVLHVCRTCVAWEFTGKSMIAGQWCPRAGISPPWLPNLKICQTDQGYFLRCQQNVWLMQALGRYSIALTESCRMLHRCLLHRGRQCWWGRICVQKLSEIQHDTCPSSHMDIILRCGRHFDEVTSACKSCREVQHDICPN